MKRILASFAATVAGLVLLLGFKTHTGSASVAAPTLASTDTTTTSTTGSSSGTNSTSTTTKSSTSTRTVTGSSVNTRWGPVQVQLTMSGSTIKSVEAVDYPNNNNRDEEINSYAIPELISEAMQAQSANIQSISGATVTSVGFINSLQSALNKA